MTEQQQHNHTVIEALAIAKTGLCSAYTFTPHVSITLADDQRVEMVTGTLDYKNQHIVIKAALRIGEWVFVIEHNTRLPNQPHLVGGFRGGVHYLFVNNVTLGDHIAWRHVLFDWVTAQVLHRLWPDRVVITEENNVVYAMTAVQNAQPVVLYNGEGSNQ